MALKQEGVHSLLVLNRVIKLRVLSQTGMYFRIFFVLHRVRVSNLQRLTYTQILVEYPPKDKFHRKQSLGRGVNDITVLTLS